MERQFDPNTPLCKCQDCGKIFHRGDEGDNEKFCLRCERIAILDREDAGDYEGDD